MGNILLDMINLAEYLKTDLAHPPKEALAHYTLPSGMTDWASRASFEAGWYQAEAIRLSSSCKALQAEIDRLQAKA